jgi:hypothetical protein
LTGLAGVALKMEMDLQNQMPSFEDNLMFNPFDPNSKNKTEEVLRRQDFFSNVYPHFDPYLKDYGEAEDSDPEYYKDYIA